MKPNTQTLAITAGLISCSPGPIRRHHFPINIALLAMQSRSDALVAVADHFNRSASTVSRPVSNLERPSDTSFITKEALRIHRNTILQAFPHSFNSAGLSSFFHHSFQTRC
jgi:hypothetical protein